MRSRGEALRDYVIRRLLLMVPTFLGITLATFVLIQFVPGGQIDQMRLALAGGGGGGELAPVGGNARVQLDTLHGRISPLPLCVRVEGCRKPVEACPQQIHSVVDRG